MLLLFVWLDLRSFSYVTNNYFVWLLQQSQPICSSWLVFWRVWIRNWILKELTISGNGVGWSWSYSEEPTAAIALPYRHLSRSCWHLHHVHLQVSTIVGGNRKSFVWNPYLVSLTRWLSRVLRFRAKEFQISYMDMEDSGVRTIHSILSLLLLMWVVLCSLVDLIYRWMIGSNSRNLFNLNHRTRVQQWRIAKWRRRVFCFCKSIFLIPHIVGMESGALYDSPIHWCEQPRRQ